MTYKLIALLIVCFALESLAGKWIQAAYPKPEPCVCDGRTK